LSHIENEAEILVSHVQFHACSITVENFRGITDVNMPVVLQRSIDSSEIVKLLFSQTKTLVRESKELLTRTFAFYALFAWKILLDPCHDICEQKFNLTSFCIFQ